MTILINEYDLDGTCGSEEFGNKFLNYMESEAAKLGYETERVNMLNIDEESEEFQNSCWDEFCKLSESEIEKYA